MVDASQLLVSSVGLMVLTACTPHERPDLVTEDRIAEQAEEMDAIFATVGAHLDEGDAGSALADLMISADFFAASEPDAGLRCDFAESTGEIANVMAERGAYPESRMAYAVALNFAQSCATGVREELLVRREDVRATQQWAEQPSPAEPS